jgi:hypothetical protein
MHWRRSLDTRNAEMVSEQSFGTLLTQLWIGSCDIHSHTQRATVAYGGYLLAGPVCRVLADISRCDCHRWRDARATPPEAPEGAVARRDPRLPGQETASAYI